MKVLLSGNEAIARGAYEAGVEVCSAYPGTPSTEIFENLPQYKQSWQIILKRNPAVLYPAHGKPFKTSDLKKYLPSLDKVRLYLL